MAPNVGRRKGSTAQQLCTSDSMAGGVPAGSFGLTSGLCDASATALTTAWRSSPAYGSPLISTWQTPKHGVVSGGQHTMILPGSGSLDNFMMEARMTDASRLQTGKQSAGCQAGGRGRAFTRSDRRACKDAAPGDTSATRML
jgi:hypothetical protein